MSLDLDAGRFGVFSLLPAVVDAVNSGRCNGRIADGRGVAAALLRGAFAAQVGTAFLRCPEAKISELGQMGCSTWIREPDHGEQEMSVWNGHCPRCGSGPRHPPVLPERRKRAKIRAGSAVHMGNPGLDARN
jgi:Nitronate monooxygenase